MKFIDTINKINNLHRTINSITNNTSLLATRNKIASPEFLNSILRVKNNINSQEFRNSLLAIKSTIDSQDFRKLALGVKNKIKSPEFRNSIFLLKESIDKCHKKTNLYKNILNYSRPASTLEQTYNEVLSAYINEVSSTENDTEKAAVNIAININRQANTFSLSKLSVDFYLNLLTTIFLFLLSLQLSNQSEKRVSGLIVQTQEIVIERFNQLTTTQNNLTYYIVEKSVNLRLKPSQKSTVLNVLYPNQQVRLVERKGKWIKIEYYNHLLDIHENGWCYKKYLKIMP